jgi:hypothetical protein
MSGRTVEVEARYRLPQPPSPAWLDKALTLMESLENQPNYTWGDHRLIGQAEIRYKTTDWPDWRKEAQKRGNDIVEWNARRSATGRAVSFAYALERREFRVTIEGLSVPQVEAALERVEQSLGLVGLRDGKTPRDREGLRRQYYTSVAVDSVWFEAAANALEANAERITFLTGRYRLQGQAGVEFVQRDFATWKQSVLARWNKLSTVYLSLASDDRSIVFDCDIHRELLSLEVLAANAAEAEKIIAEIVQHLSLQVVEAVPYKYRPRARYYEIIKWRKYGEEAFVRAVRKALTTAFPRPPAIVEAYTAQGKGAEDLDASYDIESFLARLGQVGAYERAKLYVEGMLGRALGIYLDRNNKRLELRSSLPRMLFNQTAAVFQDEIDINLIREEQSADAPGPTQAHSDNFFVKVFLALVPPLILAWGGIEGFKGAQKQYAVEIIFPQKPATGEATVKGKEFEINWVVRLTQWWRTREAAGQTVATVRVFDEHGSPVFDRSGLLPLASVTLAPGRYVIEVESPGLGLRDRLPVTVQGSK